MCTVTQGGFILVSTYKNLRTCYSAEAVYLLVIFIGLAVSKRFVKFQSCA